MKKGTIKKKKKNGIVLIGLIFIIVLLIGGLVKISFFSSDYKIENRVENMKKTEEKEKDKVLSWIRVQGTNIDMPVIYRDTNTDLEKLDYDFAWSYPKTETLTNRAIFTSHNVLNVSSNPLTSNENFRRFESLPAFLYPTFAEENQFIQYTVGGKNYMYRIFSVGLVREDTINYDADSFSEDEMKSYIQKAKEESYYDYDIEVDEKDSVITLITCTRFFGATSSYAMKVEARKIRDHEKTKLVDLRVKSNYHEIEERMKEGDSDATA